MCCHGLALQGQSWVVTEIVFPTKPKRFAHWPITGKVCWPRILSLAVGPEHASRSPGGCGEMQLPGPTPLVSDQAGLEWACEFACLTGCQMKLMLLVPGPYFENCITWADHHGFNWSPFDGQLCYFCLWPYGLYWVGWPGTKLILHLCLQQIVRTGIFGDWKAFTLTILTVPVPSTMPSKHLLSE